MNAATFSYYYERLREEHWSQWYSLEQETFASKEIPRTPGLYQVGIMDKHRRLLALTYLGQTGRGLRERIGTLWKEMYKEQKPDIAPHVAAPAHWSLHRFFSDGQHLECSVFELPDMPGKDMRIDREGLESLAIMLRRQTYGLYPLVNFGSFRQETMQERLAFVHTALADLPLINLENNDPLSMHWLDLPWSDWQQTSTSKQITQRGMYRVLDLSEHLLTKIGFGSLADGLSEYRPKRSDATSQSLMFSWFSPLHWQDYHYHALCNDLAAAHVIVSQGVSIAKIAA